MADTPHDCVKQINDLLVPHNTRLAMAFSFSEPSRELIALRTEKVDSKVRGKPVSFFAAFCPFCGVKLKKD